MWTKILSIITFLTGLRMQLVLIIIAAIIAIIHNGVVQASDPPAFEDPETELGTDFVAQLRNDANLDLSVDEEYEDLRAELLAYHTTLARLSADAAGSRRSLSSTPCWKLHGICINYQLCTGFKYLTQVPGCRGRLNVCCFTWNNARPRPQEGLHLPVFPWGVQYEFGGKGILGDDPQNDNGKKTMKSKLKKKHKKLKNKQKDIVIGAKNAKADESTSSDSEVVINKNFKNHDLAKRRSLNLNQNAGLEEDIDGTQKTWKIIMVEKL